jgi:CsoR family transcriptional regulator, copper-sensing transcriptional repressor
MSRGNTPAACGCGCGEGERKAVGVDPEAKEANLVRLKRIEGQIRGIARMVAEDRYCADVITQISAVQEALRGVSRRLMRNHLRHCASAAIRTGTGEAERIYDELVDLMFKGAR